MKNASYRMALWSLDGPRFMLVSLFALLCLAASNAAWADPPGRVGRIGDTSGNVWLYDDDQAEWIQPLRNRPVTEGNRLSSERGARAEVDIGAATLRLDGDTDLEFEQLDDARVRIRLHSGRVALRLRAGDSAREFSIVTREGRYDPLRAGRYRVDVKDGASLGAALAGSLRFEASDSLLDLQAGQRAEFWSERGVTHYAWSKMPDDRFAEWVQREEREEDRERRRYVSPEMTGAEDLERYGQWDRHPDYGPLWYPTTVAVGWAPYRYGHWAYLRPWGWTWVDDAPWGFAPFHYGRWVHWHGRWGWVPGQYVARPVYAPALVGWFGGPNFSVGISIGGPAVGWVPLSPREVYVPSYQVTNVYVRNVNVTHRHWHGPNPNYERAVPTGPIMYTNQGVAGGVTVVPQAVMRSRQPISTAVALPVDPRTVSNWRAEAPQRGAAPVPPPSRVIAAPGGAVPAPPGIQRPTPWSSGAPRSRVGAAQGDGGEASRAPAREGRPGAGQVIAPAPGAAPAVVAAPQAAPRDGRERRQQEMPPDRRVAPPVAQPVQPVAPAMQPVQPVQPAPGVVNAPQAPGRPPSGTAPGRGGAQPAPAVVQPVQTAQPAPAAPPQRGQRDAREGREGDSGERQDRGQRRGDNREQQNR
jgi:hypothetical protein